MKLLLISDQEEPYLWDYYQPGRLAGYDMILSAGDLKPSYLRFLVTMANRPLLYVHGNHDVCYATDVPEGCDCVDGTLTVCKGLRILAFGGCVLYNGKPHQYTERQMERRFKLLDGDASVQGEVEKLAAAIETYRENFYAPVK